MRRHLHLQLAAFSGHVDLVSCTHPCTIAACVVLCVNAAYRKVCLEHHPDKKLVGVDCDIKKVEAEEHFKKIQEAYDTLSDPAKRREYDSVDEFDDSLPLDCDPADFFKVRLRDVISLGLSDRCDVYAQWCLGIYSEISIKRSVSAYLLSLRSAVP